MGTGLDVEKDQCLEMDHREAVRIDRTVGYLRHVVVNQPEDRGGEKKRDRVMAVTTLDERILDPGLNRVAF